MFPSWVWFSIVEKCVFLQYCSDSSKKFNSIAAIYIYASEISYYSLSENDMVYRGLSHRSRDISNYNIKKDADSAEIYGNSSILNPNIFKILSHSIISNATFWKCITRTFICIYVNCFNRLRFHAEFSTKLQKRFDNSRNIT